LSGAQLLPEGQVTDLAVERKTSQLVSGEFGGAGR
jgi:hypothetical protein